MTRSRLIIPCTAVLVLFVAVAAAAGEPHRWRVVNVTDGDRRRQYAAPCPPPRHRRARAWAAVRHGIARPAGSLVKGKTVKVHDGGRDKYGRTLGRIEFEGQDVNRQIVTDGMAWVQQRSPAGCRRAGRTGRRQGPMG